MQKIRIGNDIRLSISLVDKTEYSASNIKNIKCYLVNKTLTESMNKKMLQELVFAKLVWMSYVSRIASLQK